MARSITPNQIKQNNRNRIYGYIYESRKKAVTQQEISYALGLSRPTVTANLGSLEEAGLIQKAGYAESEYAGRKAVAYRIDPGFRLSFGVELLERHIKLVAVDLYGALVDRRMIELPHRDTPEYYRQVCRRIIDFQRSIGVQDSQVLGVGFAIQGLVSADRQQVIYGKILSCTGLTAQRFARHLPYPCCLSHDADSAAVSELWVSPELHDAVYLSLSRHLGAAIIAEGTIRRGKHGHNATVEHIQADPNGRPCYCGRRGCIETLCSMEALLQGAPMESAGEFFARLRAGEAEPVQRWQEYLTHLARAINLIHLVQDTDFILGGYLARYLRREDLETLYRYIREQTPFEERQDFLYISKMPQHNISIGAALPYIRDFLDGDLPETAREASAQST